VSVLFRSSRAPDLPGVSFRDALLRGLAPDGGLYLPDRVPPLPDGWGSAPTFAAQGAAVLRQWISEPGPAELEALLADALDFPVPLVPLSRRRFVLELFHGPTLSFKDFGARTMARLMDHYLRASGRPLTILVATSGDTGSAVADGFAGLDNLRVVLLFPKGMVSDVQERQLTAARTGLRSLRVSGTFDDCQRMVKEALAHPSVAHLPLSSANSINVGRLLPQQLYYLWAAAELERRGETEAPVVSVPSGNLGNLTAGMLAACAGLPVSEFIAAHNANDYFPRFLGGEAAPYEFEGTVATLSNAMDVGAPSNFERLHEFFGSDLPRKVSGESVDDRETQRRMRQTFDEDGYVTCPHTAVGLEALERYRQRTGDQRPGLVLATAHPAKFPLVVSDVLDRQPPGSSRLDALLGRPAEALDIDASTGALLEVLVPGD
jgi:threonine synthase